MKRQTTIALATSALTAVSVVLAAPSASADLVTYCIGTGGAVTIPTDLFVPPGESCELDGTTVTGNVRVAADADLVVRGGTFNRDVQVAAEGYFDATNTRVGGNVVLAPGGFGVFVKDSEIAGITIQPKGSATTEGFLFVEHATVGDATSSVGEVVFDKGAVVTGNLTTNGAYYTDLQDSFVDGTLTVQNNPTGSVVCGSAVQGKATFTGNGGGVQLGPNGTLDSCASGGYFGRDVSISGTTGQARVDDNIIQGQLQLATNNPTAIVAGNNRIRGGIVGDHQAAGESAARMAAAERQSTIAERVQERRDRVASKVNPHP
jgi:hypothetical protein